MPSKGPRTDASYLDVMADMRRRIASGAWGEGERIPTIDALEALYPYSRMTIVRAARELKMAGELIARGKGGTIVAPRHARRSIGILYRLNFEEPSHAEFTFRVADLVRGLIADAGMRPVLFDEAAFPYPDDLPSTALMQAGRTHAIQGLISVQSQLPAWRATHPDVLDVPCVDIGVFPSRYRVFVDFMAALDVGIHRLHGAGCRSIGLIGNLPPMRARLCELADAYGFRTREDWIRIDHTRVSEAFGYESLSAICAKKTRPRAIFVSDDVVAKGAAQAAVALGLRVPEDLRLICMANRGIDRFYPCLVDRVDMDMGELARSAVELMTRVMDGRAPAKETISLPPVGTAPMLTVP